MGLCCSKEEKLKISKRLRRIEGQVRGIEAMIDAERECDDVLNQLASTSAALRGVWKQVVRAHLNGHVRNALKSQNSGKKIIDSLVAQIEKMR